MQTVILVVHLLICLVLVGAVLMQRSEGGALGMGGGGGGGLISGRGAADMMVNITSWVGGVFFVTSLLLAVLASSQPADRSVIDEDGRKGGLQFQIPGLPGSGGKDANPVQTPAPAAIAPSGDAPVGAIVPAPKDAVTRAAPLTAAPASTPAKAQQNAAAPKAAQPRPPVGAAPGSTAAPVGSGSAPAVGAAPMIPLSPAPAPAPSAESGQPSTPAPAAKEKTGPDE
jgi:preprotein translocase subunit SecG